jgi:hypothetical protein
MNGDIDKESNRNKLGDIDKGQEQYSEYARARTKTKRE